MIRNSKIVNFYFSEAGLISKWGRISPGIQYRYQIYSSCIIRHHTMLNGGLEKLIMIRNFKIVNFHLSEAGLTSKLGRISPGVYRWHQKQSIYVPRPCLNVVIIQSVWLVSWKHRWRFLFFFKLHCLKDFTHLHS